MNLFHLKSGADRSAPQELDDYVEFGLLALVLHEC